ncbi:alcohol dehydrogenase catalytic domain-containing protein [Ectobacillus funiculus]|uniref:zinc-dependent alcohol dehydrogenase n=1 Tax=Ectobacillus funiculus TaxID=137993 RepID=UPI00397D74AB
MKAVVKSNSPQKIELQEKALPVLNVGEVLVEVAYCGVCGSDLHAVNHSKGYEFVQINTTLGHEISGKVVEVFDKENRHLINKNVIVESMNYCNECENCKRGRYSICLNNQVIGLHFDGGMTQFVKTNANFIKEINNDLPIDIAALIEPMSIAVHAVKKIKNLGTKDTILVQGPGIIGFFIGLICAHKKAKVILSGLEKDYEYRLSKANDFGMTILVADKQKLEVPIDYIFECSGSSAALKTGFNSLKKGGEIVVVALYEQETSLFLTNLVRNEWPLITSYGCDPVDYTDASKLLIEYGDQIREIISFFPLAEAEQAFKESIDQKVLKALIYN